MDALRFGARARRRARRRQWLRRIAVWTWAVTIVGLLAGFIQPTKTPLAFFDKVAAGFSHSHESRAITSTGAAAGLMKFQAHIARARVTPAPSASTTTPVSTPSAATAIATPAATAYESGSVSGAIAQAAAEFGLSADYLIGVADCESGLDPHAYNAAGYYGLFQFDQTTWSAYGYGSIYDVMAQARTAARLLAAGESSRWPNCA